MGPKGVATDCIGFGIVEWTVDLWDTFGFVVRQGLEVRVFCCKLDACVTEIIGSKEVGAHNAELEGNKGWVVPCLRAFGYGFAFGVGSGFA